ncbi:MAG TPA: MBL fold metallo-hydrolase [Opitutaceae bacterium]|nr:MBL fold metallo-hydrolase [Opitutaceae bacterium]
MIQPALQDEAFLADVAAGRGDPSRDRLHVWWLGQSGFLVAHAGGCVLFDPYLSDSLTRKYAATDKPHVRMTARVVDPARLDFLTAVTSSHTHTDHLDAETLNAICSANAQTKLVLAAANVAFTAQRLGLEAAARFVAIGDGERRSVGPFSFECVPAAHEQLAPEFAGFVLRVGKFTLYHSGDTVLFPGMEARLRPIGIDVAFLPINGAAPERRVSGNLDGPQAAQLAHAIGARWVVPCHYEMFAFNTASPAAFVAECNRLNQPHAVLRAGERWTVQRGTAHAR